MKFIVIQDTIINLKKINRISKSSLTTLEFVSGNEPFYITFKTIVDRDEAYKKILNAIDSHLR